MLRQVLPSPVPILRLAGVKRQPEGASDHADPRVVISMSRRIETTSTHRLPGLWKDRIHMVRRTPSIAAQARAIQGSAEHAEISRSRISSDTCGTRRGPIRDIPAAVVTACLDQRSFAGSAILRPHDDAPQHWTHSHALFRGNDFVMTF